LGPLLRLQVDYMHKGVQGITYTPTFAIYKQGRKVGEGTLWMAGAGRDEGWAGGWTGVGQAGAGRWGWL